MSLFSFLIIAALFSTIVYIFTDSSESVLYERLKKHSLTDKNPKINLQERNNQLTEPLGVFFRPLIKKMLKRKKSPTLIKQLLLEAGKASSDENVVRIIANQIFYAFIGAFLGIIICCLSRFDSGSLFFCLLLSTVFYKWPKILLKRKIKERQTEIIYNLPDALDLLTICVEAGLSVDAAFARVSKEFARTCDILAIEFERVSKDILSGLTRQESFKNLALRNNIDDIKTLVALLIQTDKLGTSISQSLRTYSDTMRTKRRQRAEGLAQQASVKMVFPLVFFVMPALFVVVLGPALLSLMDGFGKMK